MKLLTVTIFCAFSLACGSAATQVQPNANSRVADSSATPQSVIAHASENEKPTSTSAVPGEKKKWTQSGDPIDTAEFDAAVAAGEKALAAKPTDGAAKKKLAEAYYNRGFALTEARQYASALGDYRRALKQDPANAESKSWIDKIIVIYDSINKDYPKEGEEPPALPFAKK